jgi:hypothetical protein
MGPNITALGEMDFMIAQTNPARHIIPFSGHILENATRRIIPKKARIVPEKGILRL